MTSVLAVIALIIPVLLLYSPKVEQNRIVTINRPLVITQERKTPAYYLYQQVKAAEKPAPTQVPVTTYLSSQSYALPEPIVATNEMRVDRREIASEVDSGFSTAAVRPVFDAEKLSVTPGSVLTQSRDSGNNLTQPQPEPTKLSPDLRWATLRGKFESQGFGFINQVIELKRIEEGQVRELGKVDLSAGLYSIDIESPKGILVALIKDRSGAIVGEAYQKIENLISRGNYFEGPFIQVRPAGAIASRPAIPASRAPGLAANSKVNGKLSAANKSSGFTTTLFSNQNTLENPDDEYTNISRHASTVAAVIDQMNAYRRVISIRQTGDTNSTPVFSEKWIKGMLEYISDQQKIEFKSDRISIVMGRAMVDGKPTAGMQMQIENHPGVYPIYLDQFMIPNSKQTETSDNGYFMFVGLEDAAYTISAFRDTQIMGHQMFIAQEGSISYQDISATSKARSIIARSFDAFTSEPIEADVTTPDLEEIVQTTSGVANYYSHTAMAVSQFMVRTNDRIYAPIRYFQDARKDYVHFPMIREDWLKQIQTHRMINDQVNTSTFVGFVPDMDYQVYLVYEGYSKDQVVYFDTQGRISPVPVKGGGFIMYNVPQRQAKYSI